METIEELKSERKALEEQIKEINKNINKLEKEEYERIYANFIDKYVKWESDTSKGLGKVKTAIKDFLKIEKALVYTATVTLDKSIYSLSIYNDFLVSDRKVEIISKEEYLEFKKQIYKKFDETT